MKKTVGIIMGGFSTEFDISILSGNMVYDALLESDYKPYKIIITKDRWYALKADSKIDIDKNDFSFYDGIDKVKVDVVFNAIHGSPGEDGTIQGYFKMLNIPHTSCDVFESGLTFNKSKTNMIVSNLGIQCPKGVYLSAFNDIDKDKIIKELGLPVFVKPARAGSSYGVTKVSKESEFETAITEAKKEDTEILIEAAVSGMEVGCGVVSMNNEVQALAITEIVPQGEFFDFKAKYEGASEEITPARIPDELTQKIFEKSIFIYQALSLKGIARVDYIIDNKTKEPIFIEVNTVPGLSKESIVPKQLEYRGINKTDFFTLVLDESIKRS